MTSRTRRAAVVSVILSTACVATACTGAAEQVAGGDPIATPSTTSTPAPTDPTTAPPAPTTSAPTVQPPDPDPVVPSAADLKAGRSTPVEDPHYPQTSNPELDVLHYDLGLSWAEEQLHGVATLTFRATKKTDSVRLDLSGALDVSRAQLDGDDIGFSQADDGLELGAPGLVPGEAHTLTIDYAGTPEATPAPSTRGDQTEGLGWNVDETGSVYTFQEPYGAFTWYPVNDHPSDEALYDARIVTGPDEVGVFNGEFGGTSTDGDANVTSWHVDEPVASYLTTIAIGPYTQYETTTDSGMAISYWLRPQDEDLLPALTKEGNASFEWLVDHAGPYPFSTLGVVVVGGFSAMETQTMITMSRDAVERSDAVLEHEMAHQWFGDAVGPRDWTAVWLNEGFAMYMQQWYETDTGRPPYAGGIDEWGTYDNMSRLVSGPPGDYDPQSFADSNVYLGPAMMLDQIRKKIGDDEFEQLVKAWPAEHDNEEVDRSVFTSWVNKQTGQDLTPLIDRWLDSPTTPLR